MEKPKVVKAVEKAPEIKQGVVTKAVVNAHQSTKAQAGAELGAEKGANAQSNGQGQAKGASSDELAAYRAKLQRALQRRADRAYPQREKMMRRTGVVTISFTLSPSGTVVNAKVIRSSGNENLDNAAVNAAEGTSLEAPPAGFPTRLEVPVKFSIGN